MDGYLAVAVLRRPRGSRYAVVSASCCAMWHADAGMLTGRCTGDQAMSGYPPVVVRLLSQEVWIVTVSCVGCAIGCAGAGLLTGLVGVALAKGLLGSG